VELEQNANQFQKLGLIVAGISYDTVEVLHNFAERKSIHFPLLSDPESKIIREVGILNQDIPQNNPFFGIPHPGTFILDNKGVVVAKYFEEDYKQRFTAADILVQRYGIMPEPAHTEVQGKQLKAVTSASNSMVRGGQRIALVIDIELKPNMHVYAPGVEGYIPIDWKIKDSDAWTTHPVSYPTAEKLFLKAINETVPVYKGHLRLTRDITIGQEAKVKPVVDQSGTFVVEGMLRYQACDDRMCYIPQELPLKWALQFEGLDRVRVPVELQRKTR
jgi:AhpC/TSA family/Disulphide bond corrector protein DsbC